MSLLYLNLWFNKCRNKNIQSQVSPKARSQYRVQFIPGVSHYCSISQEPQINDDVFHTKCQLYSATLLCWFMNGENWLLVTLVYE